MPKITQNKKFINQRNTQNKNYQTKLLPEQSTTEQFQKQTPPP